MDAGTSSHKNNHDSDNDHDGGMVPSAAQELRLPLTSLRAQLHGKQLRVTQLQRRVNTLESSPLEKKRTAGANVPADCTHAAAVAQRRVQEKKALMHRVRTLSEYVAMQERKLLREQEQGDLEYWRKPRVW